MSGNCLKRLNPKTNRPFKRWDEDDRGYVFWSYQKTVLKKDGYFQESWLKKENVGHLRPVKKSQKTKNITKRLNPETGHPFKRWDKDPKREGHVFWGYRTKESDLNGFCLERWKKYIEVRHLNPFGRLKTIVNPKLRLNPQTGSPFQRWDTREDGKVFWRYRDKPNKRSGYLLEDWREQEKIPYPQPQQPNPILKNPPRRVNPETGVEFVRWDRDKESGMIFWNYEDNRPVTDEGFSKEYWRAPDNLPYDEPQEPEITFLKQCTKCSLWKVRSDDFYKSDSSYDGRQSWCRTCKNVQGKKYYSENKDKHSQLTREYYEDNKIEISQKFRDRYQNDPEFKVQRLTQYYLREERTKICTPSWVKPQDLTPFYEEARRKTEETGIKHHVDHIIPISHDLICGLNCPNNLQVLTAEDNLRKSNKFEIEF